MKNVIVTLGCVTCLALPALAEPDHAKHNNGHKGKAKGHYKTRVTPNYGRSTTVPNNVYVPTTSAQPYHWSVLDRNRNGVLESWELQQQGYQVNTNYNMNVYDLNRDGYINSYEASRMNQGGGLFNFLLQVAPHLIR
jgi:hypothetical protein